MKLRRIGTLCRMDFHSKVPGSSVGNVTPLQTFKMGHILQHALRWQLPAQQFVWKDGAAVPSSEPPPPPSSCTIS
jgi:hypothetical protein